MSSSSLVRGAALAAAFLSACATTRPVGSPPETELSVVDESGEALPGEIQLWSRSQHEDCTVNNTSCTVALPPGDYSITFRKLRPGRVGGSIGGSTGGEKASGCLRARVTLNPGKAIRCKKRAEFNCDKAAYDTMDCGASGIARYGYKPGEKPEVDPDDPAGPPAAAPGY